ncbi:HalOD1 output domain-containing protein [Halosimplex halophilum]|uniref:HalOD1 output domain-containing protein n=1 Tax=Halosimplex halophilum TaxID=2559572 RepID=UPI00107F00EC|nr:HalOD1 output domain-containing protein [Halosimplex halophilum]
MYQTDPANTDSDSTTTRHDGDRTLLSAIVEAVGAETGRDPLDLDPLYSALDTEALERVVSPDRGADPPAGHLRFRYESCDVTVTGDGRVTAARRENGAR